MNAMRANQSSVLSQIMREDAFSRIAESDDTIFYSTERPVNHIDSLALSTIGTLIGGLVTEENPVILDLMASWDSHIPDSLRPSKVVGLGLNEKELQQNKTLSEYVLHDLNRNIRLPFADNTFDAVLNTVSVDYMTRPVQIFQEVGRILKPGGLFLVVFSNRMFPEKAVKVWRESGEEERVLLVEDFFREAGLFEKPSVFLSKGRPRPKDDKYAHLGIPSDPVYAVYADRKGGDPRRKARPEVTMSHGRADDKDELEKRKRAVKETLRCPHCGDRLRKWAVPDNPFAFTWDADFLYICFNDDCPYYVRGWNHMSRAGNRGVSYRLMYNPKNDCCTPIPVFSPRTLREGIIE